MRRFSLSRRERLRGKNDFACIFSRGIGIQSDDEKMRGLYYISEAPSPADIMQPGIRFAPIISKKSGNAVWRNRMRRIIKTVYRTEKNGLIEACKSSNKCVLFVIIPLRFSQRSTPRVSLHDLQPSALNLINKITQLVLHA